MNLFRKFLVATWPLRKRFGLVRTRERLLKTDLTPVELELLRENVRLQSPGVYLELGVFLGGSFRHVLAERDALGLATECFGVDIWDEITDQARNTHHSGWPNRRKVDRALRRAGFDRFMLLTGTAANLKVLIPGRVDLAFHDANHTYEAVREDMHRIGEIMSPGGRLLVHNASQDRGPDRDYVAVDGGPHRAVIEASKGGTWELVEIRERMAVLRKSE